MRRYYARSASNKTDDWPAWFVANATGLVVQVQITCMCGLGGVLALPAGRQNGEWIVGGFDHSFQIDYWLRLPEYAPRPPLLS